MSPKNEPNVNDALGGLLGALMGGNPSVQSHMDKTGQSLDQVLGSISGSEAGTGGQSSAGMGDLFGSLLGGSAPAGGMASQGQGGDLLGSLLGGLLGGGGAPASRAPSRSQGGDALGSLLGDLVGGAPSRGKRSQAAGSDAIGSLLGGLLGFDPGGGVGGIANNPLANSFIQPIVDALARKTGMAPGIARVVVVFALTALMGAATQKATPAAPGKTTRKATRKLFDAGDLVNRLATDGTVSQKYLVDSGLVAQLAQQSGLDQQTAAKSLQQAFAALGTHVGDLPAKDQQAQLQTLLANWE